MTKTRWLTEMGMGVDVHGNDYTKAARRAVSDALRHSSLNFFKAAGKTKEDMHIEVVIGCANPSAIDVDAVASEVPYGTVTVRAEVGGLDVAADQPKDSSEVVKDPIVMANAAILVSFTD